MAYKSIREYGLIGDMNSAALVGTDGSIDWCCFPRFDSPSVFASILDDVKGGRFQIVPADGIVAVCQEYLPDTNILATRFRTPTGELSLTDFMPLRGGLSSGRCPHEIHRVVRCVQGTVELRCTFQPRLGYGQAETVLSSVGEGVVARGGRQILTLCSQVPLTVSNGEASARFTLRQGEETAFVLAYGHRRPHKVGSYHTCQKLKETKASWEDMAARVTYDGMWRDQVVRSFLALHLLFYEPTGAMVAAPTSSLPETVGGSRNWDYRFSWLRDSSFTMDVLYRMGHVDEATRYLGWLLHQCKVTNGHTRIVYGISANSSLKESTLDHLEGHMGSSPVRIGNAAARHLQLDVFGEVILGVYTRYEHGGGISGESWSLVENFAEVVARNWHQRDRGLWEVRGAQQHFVYSKLMCWVALDRAALIGAALGHRASAKRWRRMADVIKAEILHRGWSRRKGAFVQRYDSDAIDASSLVIPFLKFLPPNDPRVLSTLEAVRRELAQGPLVRRYIPEETDDGLGGQEEGAFTLLSFWLIGNLIHVGRVGEAKEYLEEMLGYANHLGLLPEMINPRTKEFLGNYPQAYSHVGLIHTARNLSRALNGRGSRGAS